jgi:hypothetical protein
VWSATAATTISETRTRPVRGGAVLDSSVVDSVRDGMATGDMTRHDDLELFHHVLVSSTPGVPCRSGDPASVAPGWKPTFPTLDVDSARLRVRPLGGSFDA